ncbi:unnamed protein product [Onchocerca ochengi]|uniref:Lactamase_B domain-containing protein n=1 Tax=Onchocerca ochengi TaxID=42157 RepID=A0A182ENN7_ONCOC|nr:unnamed protein product [Onchocerca ochengi]
MMDKYPKVYVLLDGYCRQTKRNGHSEASGTVTLVMTEKRKILVDCGDPWNGTHIIRALSKYSLNCADITDLIITHGHSDHCGNLSLFQQARIYMNDDVAKDGIYENICTLDNSVQIRSTPGHTDHDRSIIVTGTEYGTVAIVGDIFEEENDNDSWKANSKYPEEQEKSRRIILNEADWIIPGHGGMFRNKLKYI